MKLKGDHQIFASHSKIYEQVTADAFSVLFFLEYL
jgi:hypothetical protein